MGGRGQTSFEWRLRVLGCRLASFYLRRPICWYTLIGLALWWGGSLLLRAYYVVPPEVRYVTLPGLLNLYDGLSWEVFRFGRALVFPLLGAEAWWRWLPLTPVLDALSITAIVRRRGPVLAALEARLTVLSESCRRCGYSRRGLAPQRACPECGLAPTGPRYSDDVSSTAP